MTRDVARWRLLIVGLVLFVGATALLAVPRLRDAARRASAVDPTWLIGGTLLELASCVSFREIVRRFFDEIPAPDARRLAGIEQASGALLPASPGSTRDAAEHGRVGRQASPA